MQQRPGQLFWTAQKRSGQYTLCLAALLWLLCLIPTIAEASICSRTEQVRDAIIAKVAGKTDCAEITDTDLAGITGTLALNGKSIASLKAADFDGLTGLTFLNLSSNKLSSLPPGIFDQLTGLTFLALHYNNLNGLSAGVFDKLDSLSSLNLYDNDLSNLPEDIFDELASLTVLNLGGNRLSSLPAGVFDQLTGLIALGLHRNRNLVASSLDGAFDQLTGLIGLNLQAMNLSSLPAGVFDKLTSLTELHLGHNKLSSLPPGIFDQLTGLTFLALHYNNLNGLPAGVFDQLSNLDRLVLSGNKLSSLPTGIFDQLTGLRVLLLSNNKFSSLPEDVFARLSSLGMLWLNNNTLVALPWRVFSRLYNLGHLNLKGNSGLRCLPLLPAQLFNLGLDKDKSAYAACDVAMLIASDVTVTTAKLTLTNRSEAWSYKGNHVSCTNVAAGTNEVNLTGLRSGWDYLIDAYPAHGCPANSSPHYLDSVIFTTLFPKIEGVSVTAGVASLSVGWTAQSETFGQVGYHVQWKSGNQDWSSERQSDVSTNAATISGLTGNVTYTVRVRSHFRNFINRIKYGAWSDPVTGTPAITVVTLTAGNITHNSATLTITGHTAAWWYKRTAPSGDDTCHSVAAGTATASLSSLSPNTDYTYKAYSDSACTSELATASTDAEFLTEPHPAQVQSGAPPEMPASVTVTRGDGTLMAAWPAVESATSYQVTYIADGEAEWSVAAENHPGSSIVITGVDNARTYTVGVRARNGHGDSGLRSSPATGSFTPATVSVGDVAVREEDGMARLEVTVDGTPLNTFRVQWSTADGSARQGHDYVFGRGFIELGSSNGWRAIIEVQLIDDTVDEGEETFLVHLGELTEVPDVVLARGTATVTIADTDPMPKAWLARFGRTVAGLMVDAVTERLDGGLPGNGGLQVTLGGQRIETAADLRTPLDLNGMWHETWVEEQAWHMQAWPKAMRRSLQGAGERIMTAREFLLGSAFHVASQNKAAGRSFAAWGRAAVGNFDGTADGVAVNGEVVTTTLGADVEGARWLVGLALSHSTSDGSFTPSAGDDTAGGKVESMLTGIWPYVRLTLNELASVWGLLGHGEGTLTLAETGRAPVDTDLSMAVAAAGGRGVLAPAPQGGGFEFALKADALLVRTTSERIDGMEKAEADVSRIRLLLDASRPFEFGGATLIPRAELGLRLDGGDAEDGMGVELGAGVSYAGDGVSVEGFVRGLVAHEQTDHEEWGAGLSVGIEPGAHGRGLSLSLSPAWGEAAGGTERLWSAGSWSPSSGHSPAAARRLDAQVGYGFGVPGGPGVVTLWAGLGLAQDRSWRAGLRWQLAPGAVLSLAGTRREPAGDHAPNHELTLRVKVRW